MSENEPAEAGERELYEAWRKSQQVTFDLLSDAGVTPAKAIPDYDEMLAMVRERIANPEDEPGD